MMSVETGEAATAALAKLGEAIDWAYERAVSGIPGVSGAASFAQEYLRSHPNPDVAIDKLVAWQVIQAGAIGFVTGVGGAITLPVAIPTNILSVLYLQLRMVAAIANIRGHDIKSDRVKGLVVACLVGSSVVEAIREAGINIGAKLTTRAIQQIPGTAIIKLNQIVGFRLLTKSGVNGVLNLPRVVPIVGGLISGGIDAATTRGIATAAKGVFVSVTPPDPDPDVFVHRASPVKSMRGRKKIGREDAV